MMMIWRLWPRRHRQRPKGRLSLNYVRLLANLTETMTIRLGCERRALAANVDDYDCAYMFTAKASLMKL